MILKVKRFCLKVLSYTKFSCSAEFLCVSINIRSAKGFEREKMIYIAVIVRDLSKWFGTKSFFQIWFRTYFRKQFSHHFPSFVFAIHYYSLIERWLSAAKNIVCFYLLKIWRPSYFFCWFNLLNLFGYYLF